jgi:hypothetical protein
MYFTEMRNIHPDVIKVVVHIADLLLKEIYKIAIYTMSQLINVNSKRGNNYLNA